MAGVDYLADERKKAEFDVDSMKIVWAGSRHTFEVCDRISKLVANDPLPFSLGKRGGWAEYSYFRNGRTCY